MIDKRTYLGRRVGLAALMAAVAVCGVGGQALAATSGGVGTGESGGSGTSDEGVFPIRGHHTYGDGLGAGRDHQGQDIMAKCGKPVVAAQAGRIELVDYHNEENYGAAPQARTHSPDGLAYVLPCLRLKHRV